MPMSKSQDRPRGGGGRRPLFMGAPAQCSGGDHEGRDTVTEDADESWVGQRLDCLAGFRTPSVTHGTTLAGQLAVTLW